MNKEINTILINTIITITTIHTAFLIIEETNAITTALIPIITAFFLIVSSFFLWKRNKLGAILAVIFIGLSLLHFLLSGMVIEMIVYFMIDSIALFANILAWKRS